MHSIVMKLSLALALLGIVPLASAAGFDCAKAGNEVERQICVHVDLFALDGRMAQAFAQARAKAGPQMEALLRDQRNWLAERNGEVMADEQGNDTQSAVELYKERIAFLEHVFDAPPTDAALLAAIVKHIAGVGQPSSASRVAALGGDGSVFMPATEQLYDPSKPLPFDTAPLVKLGDAADIQMSDTTAISPELLLLDKLRLGALYSVNGTAECVTMVLFSWQGRAVQPVPVPQTLAQNCWTTQGWLVEFQNRAYALQSDESSIAASDIETQRWNGSRWTSPLRVLVRYDYRISPHYVRCTQADCTGLTALASKLLNQYVRSQNADALAGNVPAGAQMRFQVIEPGNKIYDRQRANGAPSDYGLKALPWADVPKSYTTPGGSYAGYRDFDDSSVFFPIRWQGEWLLGRVGHAALGWRTSDDWLLGIWRWDGHDFVPVFGMAAPTRRDGFLLASWLPAKPFKSH